MLQHRPYAPEPLLGMQTLVCRPCTPLVAGHHRACSQRPSCRTGPLSARMLSAQMAHQAVKLVRCTESMSLQLQHSKMVLANLLCQPYTLACSTMFSITLACQSTSAALGWPRARSSGRCLLLRRTNSCADPCAIQQIEPRHVCRIKNRTSLDEPSHGK